VRIPEIKTALFAGAYYIEFAKFSPNEQREVLQVQRDEIGVLAALLTGSLLYFSGTRFSRAFFHNLAIAFPQVARILK
jgi:hypothetical protein